VSQTASYFDVVIVGAGLSGIGAACQLTTECPHRTFTLLEARPRLGGTWDLFRYPGVRSDSDMHTLGYGFRPWRSPKAIADGPAILDYIRTVAHEYELLDRIQFNQKLMRAEWSTDAMRWTLTVTDTCSERVDTIHCGFLHVCAGYYSYETGYTPNFPNIGAFKGDILHPQKWPEDYDYHDKKVVIIGSGATAVTLVPAMADGAQHVTMLQRSPSYIVAWPAQDRFANVLRKVLPDTLAYALTRWKNVRIQQAAYAHTRQRPKASKRALLRWVRRRVPKDFDVETHLTPRYNPWDERICLAPDGDFFEAIKSGKAEIVTDEIEMMTETGVALKSGQHIDADTIITATGLNLNVLGDIEIHVDGVPIQLARCFTYKGLGYSGVPNLCAVFGYVNASWTLRADLISAYLCRLLNHMSTTGTQRCVPRLRPSDQEMQSQPFISDFAPGYLRRVEHLLPKQGDREPWTNAQAYFKDRERFLKDTLEDGVMQFD